MTVLTTTPHSLSPHEISIVQDLITANADSAAGFQFAAEEVQPNELASLFRRLAQERRRFMEELRAWVRVSGAEPDSGRSISGCLYRWWLDLRHAIQEPNRRTTLLEAERAEDLYVEAYETAALHTSGAGVYDIVQRQLRAGRASRRLIHELRLDAEKVSAN